jgi:hypothetical protein
VSHIIAAGLPVIVGYGVALFDINLGPVVPEAGEGAR